MLELYARDFLLLSLALEHPARTGIQEKTENFLEIYGNLFLRDHTAQIIQTKSNEFIKLITDLDHLQTSNLSMFDFSLLKYKERDFLEGILKFWRVKESNHDYFPAQKCWDLRLRTYFGNRYDSRSNAFDWDFSMKLTDRKHAAIINNRVYSKWRETGLAFELRDTNYDTPNKTLASGMVFNDPRNGDKTSRRGYFGDIIVGPYLSYGIESDKLEFFKKSNESYRYTSVDVARSNVSALMESVLGLSGLNLKKYNSPSVDVALEGLKIEEIVEEEGLEVEDQGEDEEYFKIEDCKFVFLPLTVFQDFTLKSKYENFFDIVYFSNSGVAQASKEFFKTLKQKSIVIFETAKFMLEMKNEQIKSFSDRLKQIASENNLTEVNQASADDLDYLVFKN